MTPGARVAAAIAVLGPVLRGAPAERELTRWARGARYAGSGDRAAVRDHVFDALRRLRSSAWAGGLGDRPPAAMDPARVVAGLLVGQGIDPAPLFDGAGHAPPPLDGPLGPSLDEAPDGVRLDMPDWVLDRLRAGHGASAEAICEALRHRAPVHLRANLARTTRAALIDALAADGHAARPHPLSPSAVEVAGVPRGLARTAAFEAGLFELQDAASQAVVDRLPLEPGMRVLDLCAGGGGKTLAMAARTGARILAHDADPARLRDLPSRAGRAGADVRIVADPEAEGPFDLVLCDVPCSGSGAWRRQPEARWRLTPARLEALRDVQAGILARAGRLVAPGGAIAYVTCSVLPEENDPPAPGGVSERARWATTPADGADGFFLALFR